MRPSLPARRDRGGVLLAGGLVCSLREPVNPAVTEPLAAGPVSMCTPLRR